MKVLVIGGGGREHALAWKAARSPDVDEVLVAPGNAGTATEPGLRNVEVGDTDIDGLVALARDEAVGLVMVGPETPLAAGVTDRMREAGIPCFGPTAAAARLEASKAYAKEFLNRYSIPTAAWNVFTESSPALDFCRQTGFPVVIKADGLAAGKGVVIAENESEARTALEGMLSGNAFGDAGSRVVVEEFLIGEEASFIVMVDGTNILPLASSQDHKRRDAGDEGPNTGGMGAYSPAPVVDGAATEEIMERVIGPTVEGMKAEGHPFTGFLYAGLMMTTEGPKVLEFNVRFGDPETQPVMMRLRSDLVALCRAALDGRLDECRVDWDPACALGVVVASGGYPGKYRKGLPITGLDGDFPEHVKIFHAGTRLEGNQVVTSGGRVLCVTALGDTITRAQREAYLATARIGFEGAYWREDIGHRAIDRDDNPMAGRKTAS